MPHSWEKRADFFHLLLLLLIVLPLFVLVGRWTVIGNLDAFAAAAPAWQLSQTGSLDLSDYNSIVGNLEILDRWFVTSDSGAVVSNRPPGLISTALPFYLATGHPTFTNAPAVATAFATTSLALIVIWSVLKPIVGRGFATTSTVIFALGTTTWWISASELWPHGPGQLWAALAVASLASERYPLTGMFFGLSILTRPLTGVLAAVTGIAESWRLRSWRPMLAIATTSGLGLLLLLGYNRLVFGSWSAAGGYSEDFTTGAVERFSLGGYGRNLLSMLIGPRYGVLITSPIVGVSLVGLALAWRSVPGWARSTVVASLAYLALHALLNRASGGLVVFYRYPLEALALSAPALAIGAKSFMSRGRAASILVVSSATVSVLLQFLHVFYMSCYITNPVFPTCVL